MAKEHETSCGIFNEAKTFVKLHLDLTNSVRSWFFIFSKVVNVEKVSDSVGVSGVSSLGVLGVPWQISQPYLNQGGHIMPT